MGRPTEELRLPTRAVGVVLTRAGRAGARAELFVAEPRGGRTALAAEVATLLENDNQFVPVRELEAPGGARIALCAKRSIVWVAVALRERDGGGPPADGVPDEVGFEPSEVLSLYDHRHDVRIELDVFEAAVEPVIGHILYSSPADRPRLIDHLNLPGSFFRVWTADSLYLVNKQHVVRVLELDP